MMTVRSSGKASKGLGRLQHPIGGSWPTLPRSMREEPLVDVGIPVTHRWQFVGAAVESVLAQTVTQWHLVVSQDGPHDDRVWTELEPYLGDPRVSYSVADESRGAARNKSSLINSGTAPFVALLDDDDLWKPQFLEHQLEFLLAHKDVAFVFCANDVIDAEGAVTGRSAAILPTGVHPTRDFLPMLIAHNVVATPTVVVRRSAYEHIGAEFDERLPTVYDYAMWIELAAHFPVGYRTDVDACYRQHGEQQTVQARWRRANELIRLFDDVEKRRRANPGLAIPPATLGRRRAGALLSQALDEIESNDARRARRAIASALRSSPRVILDPKFPVALAGSVVGGRAAALLGLLRLFNLRVGLVGGRLDRTAALRLRLAAVRERARARRSRRHLD
jgi:Glycosyl transferase family 2